MATKKDLLGILVAVVAATMIVAFAAPKALAAEVSYWSFDDGTADDSVGTNDGAFNGGATATSDGVGSDGADFDGASDSCVIVPDSASLSALTALSVECWMKTTDNYYQGLVTKVTAGHNEWNMWLAPGNSPSTFGDFTLFVYDGSGSGFISQNTTTLGGLLNDGAWHHLVGVWDGGTTNSSIKLYVDGVDRTYVYGGYGAGITSVGDLNARVIIGAYEQRAWNFDGKMDEVRIYNHALSAADIADNYLAGKVRAELRTLLESIFSADVVDAIEDNYWMIQDLADQQDLILDWLEDLQDGLTYMKHGHLKTRHFIHDGDLLGSPRLP